jgi:hypothetical protein
MAAIHFWPLSKHSNKFLFLLRSSGFTCWGIRSSVPAAGSGFGRPSALVRAALIYQKGGAMRTRIIVLATIVAVGLLIITATASFADTLKFKDGTEREGVIKKVETGRVFVIVGTEMQEYDILTIEAMDFNTPHILKSTENVPMEHF